MRSFSTASFSKRLSFLVWSRFFFADFGGPQPPPGAAAAAAAAAAAGGYAFVNPGAGQQGGGMFANLMAQGGDAPVMEHGALQAELPCSGTPGKRRASPGARSPAPGARSRLEVRRRSRTTRR